MDEPISGTEKGKQAWEKTSPGESVAGGPAIAGGTATDSAGSMAVSVTHHAPFSSPRDWTFLACGIDSLYLGLSVRWGDSWDIQTAELEAAKEQASGTRGLPMNDGQFLILPSGKPPNYRWHLQWPGFHLFLSRSREPQRSTPNVYAAINSETLWRNTVEAAIQLVVNEIERFGGQVLKAKPSRCDLAADFLIPDDLTLEFLRALRVPSHVHNNHYSAGDKLETFYQGKRRTPIQLRIYDKSREVLKGGTKLWLLDVWNLRECQHIWRIEYQIRRLYLKNFGINTVEDLLQCRGSLWTYLTNDWFSLRLLDDSNTSRRTVHPWWRAVQECAPRFGEARPLVRQGREASATVEWYISHCGGCLVSYAARRRLGNFDLAAKELVREMRAYWSRNDFDLQYTVKSIQLGYAGCSADSTNSDTKDAA